MLETEVVACVVEFLSVVSLVENVEELNDVEIVWVEIPVVVVDRDGVEVD